jgi:hypothetical protein
LPEFDLASGYEIDWVEVAFVIDQVYFMVVHSAVQVWYDSIDKMLLTAIEEGAFMSSESTQKVSK